MSSDRKSKTKKSVGNSVTSAVKDPKPKPKRKSFGKVLAGNLSSLTDDFGPTQEDFSCGEILPLSEVMVTCYNVPDPDNVEFKVIN